MLLYIQYLTYLKSLIEKPSTTEDKQTRHIFEILSSNSKLQGLEACTRISIRSFSPSVYGIRGVMKGVQILWTLRRSFNYSSILYVALLAIICRFQNMYRSAGIDYQEEEGKKGERSNAWLVFKRFYTESPDIPTWFDPGVTSSIRPVLFWWSCRGMARDTDDMQLPWVCVTCCMVSIS